MLISSISEEITICITLCLTTFYLGNISSDLSYILETICVYTVVGCIAIQFFISLYSFVDVFKKIFREVERYRGLTIVQNYEETNGAHTKNLENKNNSVKII